MSSDCSFAAQFPSKVVFPALNVKIRTPQGGYQMKHGAGGIWINKGR